MTERKPTGVKWESWIDKQIRDGVDQGLFDDLRGKGKPLAGIDEPHDDLWWVRDKLRREEVGYLPPSLAVRKQLEETRARIAASTTESEVRDLVAAINEQIREVNSRAGDGPPTSVMPLDADDVVAQWRAQRADG